MTRTQTARGPTCTEAHTQTQLTGTRVCTHSTHIWGAHTCSPVHCLSPMNLPGSHFVITCVTCPPAMHVAYLPLCASSAMPLHVPDTPPQCSPCMFHVSLSCMSCVSWHQCFECPVMRYMCLLMPHVTRASVTVLHMLNPVYHAIHTCFLWHTHPAIGARCPITCAVHSVACYRCVHACTISPDGPALLAYSHAWLCCRLPHGDRPPPPGPDLGLQKRLRSWGC